MVGALAILVTACVFHVVFERVLPIVVGFAKAVWKLPVALKRYSSPVFHKKVAHQGNVRSRSPHAARRVRVERNGKKAEFDLYHFDDADMILPVK